MCNNNCLLNVLCNCRKTVLRSVAKINENSLTHLIWSGGGLPNQMARTICQGGIGVIITEKRMLWKSLAVMHDADQDCHLVPCEFVLRSEGRDKRRRATGEQGNLSSPWPNAQEKNTSKAKPFNAGYCCNWWIACQRCWRACGCIRHMCCGTVKLSKSRLENAVATH